MFKFRFTDERNFDAEEGDTLLGNDGGKKLFRFANHHLICLSLRCAISYIIGIFSGLL